MKLQEPGKIGSLLLKNRVVINGTNYSTMRNHEISVITLTMQ
jgi:hypothetical protein